ncbi:hypothetical protein R3P38DRAFT_617257 [Favolaschia claudopus]|uniref:Uncharacterized protein n=1 Tax=Favolaschia claudopus TaxID=2862362 RepID=A0AAW0CBB2_9AGAR
MGQPSRLRRAFTVQPTQPHKAHVVQRLAAHVYLAFVHPSTCRSRTSSNTILIGFVFVVSVTYWSQTRTPYDFSSVSPPGGSALLSVSRLPVSGCMRSSGTGLSSARSRVGEELTVIETGSGFVTAWVRTSQLFDCRLDCQRSFDSRPDVPNRNKHVVCLVCPFVLCYLSSHRLGHHYRAPPHLYPISHLPSYFATTPRPPATISTLPLVLSNKATRFHRDHGLGR